ncbi:MAG: hypothetical protein WC483_00380, partial [Candidatus Paceibacterota bacterium]
MGPDVGLRGGRRTSWHLHPREGMGCRRMELDVDLRGERRPSWPLHPREGMGCRRMGLDVGLRGERTALRCSRSRDSVGREQMSAEGRSSSSDSFFRRGNLSMAHKVKAERYAFYADLVSEMRETECEGGINPQLPSAPRTEETIPGIKLKLFDHQRLILHALRALDSKGMVRVVLPPIHAESPVITKLFDDRIRKAGIFESDAWLISLPVGSGKTLILLALIAMCRVPEKRRIIVGTDFAHSFLCSSHAEVISFPKLEPTQLSLIGDNAWYFADELPSFPSFTPKTIDRAAVADDDILPSSVLMVGPHLLGQMRGYCETQVDYPWIVIPDTKSLSTFLIQSCIDLSSTFGKYHLIILPARTDERADTVTIEVQAQAMIRKLTIGGENVVAAGRIGKMVNGLLTRQRSLPASDYLTAFCDAFPQTKVLARFIIDDYDTLQLRRATRVPALSYIFISGTAIVHPGNQFGFSSKPTYEMYARRAMTIAVEPSHVLAYIGLPPPVEQAVLCIESTAQKLFLHLCRVISYYITCYREIAMKRFPQMEDPLRHFAPKYLETKVPIDSLIEDIEKALFNDSIASVLELLIMLHRCGSEVGCTILPDELVLKPNPKAVSFGSLAGFLFRKIYSERMRTSTCLLALDCLEKTLRESKLPDSTRYVLAALKNHVFSFSFPPCNVPFGEVATVAMEPQYAFKHLSRARLPTPKEVEGDVIRSIWGFVQPRPDVMQLPN